MLKFPDDNDDDYNIRRIFKRDLRPAAWSEVKTSKGPPNKPKAKPRKVDRKKKVKSFAGIAVGDRVELKDSIGKVLFGTRGDVIGISEGVRFRVKFDNGIVLQDIQQSMLKRIQTRVPNKKKKGK
jgi:hypothetical protein